MSNNLSEGFWNISNDKILGVNIIPWVFAILGVNIIPWVFAILGVNIIPWVYASLC